MGKGEKKSHQKQHLRHKCPNWGGQKKWSFRGKEEARGGREAKRSFLLKKQKRQSPPLSCNSLDVKLDSPAEKCLRNCILHESPFPTHLHLLLSSGLVKSLLFDGLWKTEGVLKDHCCAVWCLREGNLNGNCATGIQRRKDQSLLPAPYLFHKRDTSLHCNGADPWLGWNFFVGKQSTPVLASVTSNETSC